jgi:dTDP-4-amino-4,6-dideoxygalactose transaminase
MLTTRDVELDRRFRLLRQHAMSVSDTVRHGSTKVVFEDYPEVGFNYRMTDIQAAIGRVQLGRLPGLLERRRFLAARYTEAIRKVPGLTPPEVPAYAWPNYQSYPVKVSPAFPLSRDRLMQMLLDRGISTRRGIMNSHQEGAYAGDGLNRLPASEQARDHVILLPLYPTMTDDEQQRVISELSNVARLAHAG